MLFTTLFLSFMLITLFGDIIMYSEIGAMEKRIEEPTATENNNDPAYQEAVLRRRLIPGGFTASDQSIILTMHNNYRNITAQGLTPDQPAATNMNQLVWDTGLAKLAQNYSAKCIWAHNGNRGKDLLQFSKSLSFEYTNQFVGENLFISTGGESISTILRGVQYWYQEYANYKFGTVGGTANCTAGQQCGHYTQLVWGKTRYVGCAYSKCATVTNLPTFTNAIYFACNYYFAGNFVGDYPYARGTTCSACPNDRKTCKDGLCTGCPSYSWDTYCCEYCSSTTCTNAINSGLCKSPTTCTNGIDSTLLSPTTTTTTTTTKSPTKFPTTPAPTTPKPTASPTTTTSSPTTSTSSPTTSTSSPTTTTSSPTTITSSPTTSTSSPTTTTSSPTTTTPSPTTATTDSSQSSGSSSGCCAAFSRRYVNFCDGLDATVCETYNNRRKCFWKSNC